MKAARFVLTVSAAILALVLVGCSDSGRVDPAPSLLNRVQADATDPAEAEACALPDSSPSPAPEVAATEAIAMPSDRFWALIAGLDKSTDQAGFDRISAELSRGTLDDILSFDARLTLSLYALDSQCRDDWYGHHDPDHLGPPLDDDFLYYRCSTIIAGEKNWLIASTTQTLPQGGVDPEQSGEPLLYVGEGAAELQGMSNDAYLDLAFAKIPLSYETGSNSSLWVGSGG